VFNDGIITPHQEQVKTFLQPGHIAWPWSRIRVPRRELPERIW
jgi:hypothetical protein